MRQIKKLIKIFLSGNGITISQLLNALIYKTFPKKSVLNYDPITLIIYPTDRCNYQCQFCPHHSKLVREKYPYFHEPTADLTLENFKKILDIFPKAIMLTLAGVGEPLLHPQLFEMADYAAKKHMYLQLITNGSLLDDEKIERILNNPNFFSVSISLNAINSKEYANCFDGRQELFDKVISNIKKLVQRKKERKHAVEIKVSFVIHKKNFFNSKDFIEFAQNLGVDTVEFLNLIDFGIPGYEINDQLYEDDSEVKNYFSELKNFIQKSKIKVVLPVLFKKEIKKKCQWFFRNLSVDGAGNVGGCVRVMNPSAEYGNIFKEGQKVWNNQYFQKMRKIFLDPKSSLPKCCQNCVENRC